MYCFYKQGNRKLKRRNVQTASDSSDLDIRALEINLFFSSPAAMRSRHSQAGGASHTPKHAGLSLRRNSSVATAKDPSLATTTPAIRLREPTSETGCRGPAHLAAGHRSANVPVDFSSCTSGQRQSPVDRPLQEELARRCTAGPHTIPGRPPGRASLMASRA